ncbi:MAG: hypothetical protein HYZ53_01815 [Planctomycetes bacterium]|nr:hypothetical protein [Planctomycetota bacterium]
MRFGVDGWDENALLAPTSTTETSATLSLPTALPLGWHSVWARIRDRAGNENWTGWLLYIDGEGPTLDGQTPAAGEIVSTLPSISAFVSDDDYSPTIVHVLLDGADVTGEAGTALHGFWFTHAPATFAQGEHTVTVVAQDAAGNQTTTSWSFAYDSVLPAIVPVRPVANGTVAGPRPAIEAIVTDPSPGSGVDPSAFVVALDGGATSTTWGFDGMTLRVTPDADLTAGTHNVSITAADRALPAGSHTTNASWSFTVQAPSATITPGSALAATTTPKKVTLTWTSSTDPAAVGYNVYATASGVRVRRNGALLTGTEFVETLPRGETDYVVVTVDAAGHEGADSDSVHVSGANTIVQEPLRSPLRCGASGCVTATGEFTWSVTDVSIAVGKGMGFSFTRTYRSDSAYDGPFGFGWDWSLHQRLVVVGADVDLYDGTGRVDRYVWDATANGGAGAFISPAGSYTRLESVDTAHYRIVDPHHNRRTFTQNAGEFVLTELRDRNQNTLTIEYTGALPTSVVDSHNRTVTLDYVGGRLSKIRDFAGREFRYAYTDVGDLREISSPPWKDSPNRILRTYVYATGEANAWTNHNLRSATNGRGQTFLENTYDPITDRLITQRHGEVGQNYRIRYSPETGVVSQTDPVGTVTDLTPDAAGHLVERKEHSLGVSPGAPAFYVTSWQVNAAGERTQVQFPRGNSLVYTFDESNPEPLARGNLLQARQISDRVGEADRVETWTYESEYHFEKSYTDPAGTVWQYFYDYEEAQLGDLNADGLTNQGSGNRVYIDPTVSLGQPSPQSVTTAIQYDSNGGGRVTCHLCPCGCEVCFLYDSTGYPRGTIRDPGGLAITETRTVNSLGFTTSATNANGKTFTFEVGDYGEVVTVDGPGPSMVRTRVAYDDDLHATNVSREIKDEDGNFVGWATEAFSFSTLGYEIGTTQSIDGQHSTGTSVSCDAFGRPLIMGTAGGDFWRFTWGDQGALARSTHGYGADAVMRTFTHDLNGNETRVDYGEGSFITTDYNGFDDSIRVFGSSGTVREWDRDARGDVIEARIGSATAGETLAREQYARDELGRIYEVRRQHARLLTTAPGGGGGGGVPGVPGGGGGAVGGGGGGGGDCSPQSSMGAAVGDGWSTTKIRRNESGVWTHMEDDRGNVLDREYDTADRPIGVHDAFGNSVALALDPMGHALTTTRTVRDGRTGAPRVFKTGRELDELGRPKKVTVDPDGLARETEFFYNSLSQQVKVKDPLGRFTKSTFDHRGLRLSTTFDFGGPDARSVAQSWDADGRLQSVTDGGGNVTGYHYNGRKLLDLVTFPNQSTRSIRYDGRDFVTGWTDPNGSVVEQRVNDRGQPLVREITRAPGVEGTTLESYEYDLQGRIAHGVNDASELCIKWDSLDNPVELHERWGPMPSRLVRAAFDGKSNRTHLSYPGGRELDFKFDGADRLDRIDEGSVMLASYQYVGGRASTRLYGNGIRGEWLYNGAGEVTDILHADPLGVGRAQFEYGYNAAGERLYEKRLHDGKADAYRHDRIGQLTGVKFGVPVGDVSDTSAWTSYATFTSKEEFDFDGAGNRKTVDTDGATEFYNHVNGAYVPDALNQINRIARGDEVLLRGHDANGNLIDDGEKLYTWNYRNQLLRVTRKIDGKVLASFEYDVFGNRIWKEVDGSRTYFYHDGTRVLEDEDDQGNTLATYVHGNGIDELLSADRRQPDGSTARFYFHENALGSICLVTDAAGANVEKVDYGTYGVPHFFRWDTAASGGAGAWQPAATAPTGNRFLFTGREYDAETGLYYYRARYLEASSGRFLSRDPIGRAGDSLGNEFRFGQNSPDGYTDPLGLQAAGPIPAPAPGPATPGPLGQGAGAPEPASELDPFPVAVGPFGFPIPQPRPVDPPQSGLRPNDEPEPDPDGRLLGIIQAAIRAAANAADAQNGGSGPPTGGAGGRTPNAPGVATGSEDPGGPGKGPFLDQATMDRLLQRKRHLDALRRMPEGPEKEAAIRAFNESWMNERPCGKRIWVQVTDLGNGMVRITKRLLGSDGYPGDPQSIEVPYTDPNYGMFIFQMGVRSAGASKGGGTTIPP